MRTLFRSHDLFWHQPSLYRQDLKGSGSWRSRYFYRKHTKLLCRFWQQAGNLKGFPQRCVYCRLLCRQRLASHSLPLYLWPTVAKSCYYLSSQAVEQKLSLYPLHKKLSYWACLWKDPLKQRKRRRFVFLTYWYNQGQLYSVPRYSLMMTHQSRL